MKQTFILQQIDKLRFADLISYPTAAKITTSDRFDSTLRDFR